ncbi:MAG TPA: hypothetical protein VD973_15755, partial [Symbiobacteriaceae bacterium]|nr:hypothetical protein [Symbiobacteriaceae bacterium]
LVAIASLAEEQSAALEQAAAGLSELSASMGSVSEQARSVAALTTGLSGMTETAYNSMSRFSCGSAVDEIRVTAQQIAAEVRTVLESQVDQGKVSLDALLDLTYQEYKGALVDRLRGLWGDVSRVPRNGFAPPKYATAYDHLVDVALRDMLDRYQETTSKLRFLIVSDLNGYSPAQNGAFCRPWTGDTKKDFRSRVKRLNCDLDGIKASRMGLDWAEREPLSTGQAEVRNMATVHSRRAFLSAGCDLKEPVGGDSRVLLQTSTRKTGSIVNMLSVPLYVKGHRYGAIILGWLPEQ